MTKMERRPWNCQVKFQGVKAGAVWPGVFNSQSSKLPWYDTKQIKRNYSGEMFNKINTDNVNSWLFKNQYVASRDPFLSECYGQPFC